MIAQQIANELNIKLAQVEATIALIDDGSTIPFIARYRKEITQGLDDTQLRSLNERLLYLRELEERRQTIIASIKEQGKLTTQLHHDILAADTKAKLEDLYLPYKQKRRTKGQMAIEAGIEPLANALFEDTSLEPDAEAIKYINMDAGFDDIAKVLQGAQFILMERFSEDAALRQLLRDSLKDNAVLTSHIVKDKEKEAQKYQDYFDYQEKISSVPSHRALALMRGRKEGLLSLSLKEPEELNEENPLKMGEFTPCATKVANHFGVSSVLSNDVAKLKAGEKWIKQTIYLTWKIKLFTSLELELFTELRERAEATAIDVFADNLKDLLMSPPAGVKRVIGLDPGIRTGVKTAVLDETGKVLFTSTIYPFQPQNKYNESMMALVALITQYEIDLIAIGNGTASRETDKLVADSLKKLPSTYAKKVQKIIVSEAGASVYSASELAAKEMPDLDVSLRGAVSIARRLQDPLAELVKIEPKAIGVGQYQHDVSQVKLSRMLDGVVEDCVNAVGVDLNTASAPLLSRISGLTPTLANNIIDYRNQNGRFDNREQLKEVTRLGPKVFEQAAGFLKINQGSEPLDASSVHPEAYALTKKMINDLNITIESAISNPIIKQIKAEQYVDEKFGLLTIGDILAELEKPGRDPRPNFKTAEFAEGIEKISDLKVGAWLQGVVSNITQFGAFVDIGVHQDGLVHISMMSDSFIKDPREVVKTGDIVKVKVLEVDEARKRIALAMVDKQAIDNAKPEKNRPEKNRSEKGSVHARQKNSSSPKPNHKSNMKQNRVTHSSASAPKNNSLANAFAKLKS